MSDGKPRKVGPGPATPELVAAARSARENSYSPYSEHRVGAALRTSDGRIFSGCNVENSTYGATICAERTAVLKAVSEGARLVSEIAIVTDATPPWPPCGLCLQTFAEFAAPDFVIHLTNLQGQIESYRLTDLLPRAFTPKFLTER